MGGQLNKMLRFWNRLSEVGLTDELSTGQAKRLKLVNRIGLIGGMIFLPYIYRYAEMGQSLATIVQVCTALSMWLVVGFNYARLYLLGRYFMVVVANLNLLMTSSVFGFASGEHLGFMVLTIFISLIFDFKRELIHLMVCLLLTFGSFVTLVVFDFQLIDHNLVASKQVQYESYLFNYSITVLISLLLGYYFQHFSQDEVERIAARGRRQLKAAFDHSKAGILLVDARDFALIEFNQRAQTLLAWTETPPVGTRLADLGRAALPIEALIKAIEITQRTRVPQEIAYSLPSGQSRWLMLETEDFDYQGNALLHIQVIDMTEVKLYQQDLIKAKEIAESANISRAHFLANMSHEFRTPINGIIGITELLMDEYPDEPIIQEYTTLLRESGERILRTMSLILDLAHLESGKHLVTRRWSDVVPILQSLSQEIRPRAQEKGLNFGLHIHADQASAYLDPSLLRIALEHLLSNAIKFTSHGEITVHLYRKEQPAPHIYIDIQDTGIGMSQPFIKEKLFMKFEQESEGLDRNYEGAGLGLSITKRIIDILNGSIEVESTQGKGSTFRLGFPLQDRYPTSTLKLDRYEQSQSPDR